MSASSLSEKDAGRALDAEVAEKVMGAEWLEAGPIDEHVCLMRGLPKPTHCLRLKLPPGVIYDTVTMAWRDASGAVHTPANAPGPHYSTEISAAFLVVEKMASRLEEADKAGVTFPWKDCNYLALQQLGTHAGWAATFCCIIEDDEWYEHPERFGGVKASTAPLAICCAALRALVPDEGSESDQEGSR